MHGVTAGLQTEMLHCFNPLEILAGGMDVTVLERQKARMKWQEQSQQCCFDNSPLIQNQFHSPLTQSVIPARNFTRFPEGSVLHEIINRSTSRVKTDQVWENEWPDFAKSQMRKSLEEETSSFAFVAPKFPAVSEREPDSGSLGYAISRTASCPSNFPADIEQKVWNQDFSDPVTTSVPRESFKKRKAESGQRTDVSSTRSLVSEFREKRIKGDTDAKRVEVGSKGTKQNNSSNNQRESSGDTAKENSKISEVQKPDYIHVRARRGQATDSHSLAERVRREKISERMKYLQDLVPGCNKITGKAGMLDEIINYVQSLQRQVEFLSMKLATVNPRPDFNFDDLFAKEMFPACNNSFPAMGILPELGTTSYLHFNSVQPGSLLCGIDMAINPPEFALPRTTIDPVSAPDQSIDSGFHAHGSSPGFDSDLKNLYNVEFSQGRPPAFPVPAFPGNMEVNNLKLEM